MKYIYAIFISTLLLTSCAEKEVRTVESVIKTGTIDDLRAKKTGN